MKNKKLIALLIVLFITNNLFAQVENIIKNKENYTKEIFPYKGVRIIMVDEVNSPNNEQNVFIFSKIEKHANPDIMYFQRFTKIGEKWDIKNLTTITHPGIISVLGNRKAFADYNKDKSIDVFFIYCLYSSDLKQQSTHLIFSQLDKIYTIETSASDNFKTDTFSSNFNLLDEETKKNILEYWFKLNKINEL